MSYPLVIRNPLQLQGVEGLGPPRGHHSAGLSSPRYQGKSGRQGLGGAHTATTLSPDLFSSCSSEPPRIQVPIPRPRQAGATAANLRLGPLVGQGAYQHGAYSGEHLGELRIDGERVARERWPWLDGLR